MCILKLDELLIKLCLICREYQMKLKSSHLNLRKSHMIVLKVINHIQCMLQLPVCNLLTQSDIEEDKHNIDYTYASAEESTES